MLASLLASIPSPPGKSLGIGPFQLRAYGLAIAVGVLAAVWIAQRRYARRGGHPAALAALAMSARPMGLGGGGIYPIVPNRPSLHRPSREEGRVWGVGSHAAE